MNCDGALAVDKPSTTDTVTCVLLIAVVLGTVHVIDEKLDIWGFEQVLPSILTIAFGEKPVPIIVSM